MWRCMRTWELAGKLGYWLQERWGLWRLRAAAFKSNREEEDTVQIKYTVFMDRLRSWLNTLCGWLYPHSCMFNPSGTCAAASQIPHVKEAPISSQQCSCHMPGLLFVSGFTVVEDGDMFGYFFFLCRTLVCSWNCCIIALWARSAAEISPVHWLNATIPAPRHWVLTKPWANHTAPG